jgi:hypothetical protein
VSLHRGLFRLRLKQRLVDQSSLIARVSLAGVSLLVAGVAGLVFDVVLGRAAGVTVFVSALVLLVTLWILYPMLLRRDVRS